MKKGKIVLCVLISLIIGGSATAGLVAQFDGTSANTSPSGKIMTWYDQASLGGNNDAQGVAPPQNDPDTRPLLVDQLMPNGQTMKVAQFDGYNDVLTIGGNSAFDGTNRSWALVIKADLMGSGLAFAGNYASGAGSASKFMWDTWADGDTYSLRGRTSTGGSVRADSGYGNADEWTIVIGTWQSNVNVRAYVYALEDENLTLHYKAAGTVNADAQGHIRTTIGASAEDTARFFFDGQIAEVQYYDEQLGNAEVEALAGQLQAKYVPEPATIVLLSGGLFALIRRKR